MRDAFVLDDDGNSQIVARSNVNRLAAQRRDQLSSVALDAEDSTLKTPVLQKGDGLLHLLVVAVVLREHGVGAQPAVRGELAVLGAVVLAA